MYVRRRKPTERSSERQGAMMIFILLLLIIVLAMVVYSVDVAFMQLARSELRAAVDSAAKAAAGELSLSNGDRDKAIAKGVLAASYNDVAGSPLLLDESNFELGQSYEQKDGTWVFVPEMLPYSAVRVTAEKSEESKSGPVRLFFSPLFGADTFSPKQTAVASQFKQEIVLAIDRSHSMTFDESGTSWSYPAGVLGLDFNKDRVINSDDPLIAYPDPYESRWSQLTAAVDSFIEIVELRDRVPRIALVTWGSKLDTNSYEYRLTNKTVAAVTQHTPLEYPEGTRTSKSSSGLLNLIGKVLSVKQMIDLLRNLYSTPHTAHGGTIMASLFELGSQSMHGATNASAGIDEALAILVNDGEPDAKKVIVLMTDGQWNQGRDPVEAAYDARDHHVVIHTVTFLDAAEQTTMEQVATITGGRHYHASNAVQLKAVFEELARTIPVALTE